MTDSKQLARQIRREIIESAYAIGKVGVHFGPALSIADFLAVMYGEMLHIDPQNPRAEDRDRFILSKGHAYAAFYSTLSLCGFFSQEEFRANYMTNGGLYPAHPIKNPEKGIECSSGSLGMGLSYAVGKALNAKKRGLDYTTYVALGDGECNEGSVSEALMSAVQLGLDNLVVFIDHNGYQQDGTTEEIMNIPLADVARAMGCEVVEIDGNDIDAIRGALARRTRCGDRQIGNTAPQSDEPQNATCAQCNGRLAGSTAPQSDELQTAASAGIGKPLVIVGHTVKGKGVSFMEGVSSWHHATLTEEQYKQAMEELS